MRVVALVVVVVVLVVAGCRRKPDSCAMVMARWATWQAAHPEIDIVPPYCR